MGTQIDAGKVWESNHLNVEWTIPGLDPEREEDIVKTLLNTGICA